MESGKGIKGSGGKERECLGKGGKSSGNLKKPEKRGEERGNGRRVKRRE